MNDQTKVLIIDQVGANSTWYSGCLREEGYKVLRADDTPAALRVMRRHQPDVVLLSGHFVNQHGDKVSRGLKTLSRKGASGVPIMVYGTDKLMLNDIKCDHYDAMLHMPLERQYLLHTISGCLDRQAAEITQMNEQLDLTLDANATNSADALDVPNHMLQRFVAPKVLNELNRYAEVEDWNPLACQEEVTAAVLFADVRGFTRATEAVECSEVITMINDYYKLFTERAEWLGGSVLSMAGDRLMACFGVPDPVDHPMASALGAALSIHQRFSQLRLRFRKHFDLELGLGIGIDYGSMTAGFVGSKTQLQYTVLGRVVNLAARLEAAAPSGSVMMTQRAFEQLDGHTSRLNVRAMEDVDIRGLEKSQRVYCIQTD